MQPAWVHLSFKLFSKFVLLHDQGIDSGISKVVGSLLGVPWGFTVYLGLRKARAMHQEK
jgi:hypothetical protein